MNKVYVVIEKTPGFNAVVKGAFSNVDKALGCVECESGETSAFIVETELDKVVDKKEQLWAVCLIKNKAIAMPFEVESYKDIFQMRDEGFSFFVVADTHENAIRVATQRLRYIKENPHLYPYFDQRIVLSNGATYPPYHFLLKSVVLHGGQAVFYEFADKVKIIRYE